MQSGGAVVKIDKKVWIMLACLAAAALACQAVMGDLNFEGVRGSGNLVSEERQVSGIDLVSLETEGIMTIQIGDEERLTVEAEDNLLPYIITEVRSGRLLVRTQNGVELDSTQPIRYLLTVKALEGLDISSSGDINSDALQAERFMIGVSSSGSLDIAGLNAESLRADISSSGDVKIAGGEVSELDLDVSSSGNFDAEDMAAGSAQVALSSSGDARLRVTDALNASISSSGNLYYHGDPELSVTTSSSGEAIPLDE
jgi:hypothetical protein